MIFFDRLGAIFICPKIPEQRYLYPGFSKSMEVCVGKELVCREVSHSGRHLLLKSIKDNLTFWYRDDWVVELSPPSLPSPDIEGVEDLLDHWE